MSVASSRMPPPSAVANILASVPGGGAQGDEGEAEDQRGARDQAAGAADALDHGGVGRAGAVVGLAHPAEDEHLVVHRDAEQEREDDDRHLDVDRVVASMPQIASEPQPCCQTRTISPHAAPTDSRLRITAFSGMISERKARASSRKVRPAITAITSGKLP